MRYSKKQKKSKNSKKQKEIVFFSFDKPDVRSSNFTKLLKKYEGMHPGKEIVKKTLENGCNNLILLQFDTDSTTLVKVRKLEVNDIEKICMSLAECQYRLHISDITHVGVPIDFICEYLEGSLPEFKDISEYQLNYVKINKNETNTTIQIFVSLLLLLVTMMALTVRKDKHITSVKRGDA